MTQEQVNKFVENEEKLEQIENDLRTVISFAKSVFDMLDISDVNDVTMENAPNLITGIMFKYEMGDLDVSNIKAPDFKLLMQRYEYLISDKKPKNLC